MAVSFRPIGQWGNQVFSHVSACILADVSRLEYRPNPHWRTKSGKPVQWSGPEIFPLKPYNPNDDPLNGIGQTSSEQQPTWSAPPVGTNKVGPKVQVNVEHWCDFRAKEYVGAGQIDIMHGYFQRYEIIKPWKHKIKNRWLLIRRPFVETDPEAVYIHCRLTDYVPGQGGVKGRNGVSTTLDEYRECLKRFPDAKRIVVCTDDPRSEFHYEWNKLGIPWSMHGGRWDEDFMVMASCRWLLIAQSTFSWWAGLLGLAEKIVCPLSEGTLWAKGHGRTGPASRGADWVNLEVDDEPDRWEWVRM